MLSGVQVTGEPSAAGLVGGLRGSGGEDHEGLEECVLFPPQEADQRRRKKVKKSPKVPLLRQPQWEGLKGIRRMRSKSDTTRMKGDEVRRWGGRERGTWGGGGGGNGSQKPK